MPRVVAVDLDPIFERIVQQVRALGALPRTDLARYKRHLPALAPRLREAGLEVGRSVRVPLETQLVERPEGPHGTKLSWIVRKGTS